MLVDSIDLKLLRLLGENSKRTLRELGREVGLSVSAVRKRIKRLENLRVIKKYTVVVDHKKLGLGLTAFANLDVDPRYVKDFIRMLSRYKGVYELHRVTGKHGLMLKIRARDMASLNKFLENLTDSSDSVREIETLVAIETFKETS